MKIELKIKLPMTPNFVYLEMPPGTKQDRIKELPEISIDQLSDEQIKEIGAAWTAELLAKKHARKKDVSP